MAVSEEEVQLRQPYHGRLMPGFRLVATPKVAWDGRRCGVLFDAGYGQVDPAEVFDPPDDEGRGGRTVYTTLLQDYSFEDVTEAFLAEQAALATEIDDDELELRQLEALTEGRDADTPAARRPHRRVNPPPEAAPPPELAETLAALGVEQPVGPGRGAE